jgi:hypothetical protein
MTLLNVNWGIVALESTEFSCGKGDGGGLGGKLSGIGALCRSQTVRGIVRTGFGGHQGQGGG